MRRVRVEIAGRELRAWAEYAGDELALVVVPVPPGVRVAKGDQIRSGGEAFFVHSVEDVAGRGEELRLRVGRHAVPDPVVADDEEETSVGLLLDRATVTVSGRKAPPVPLRVDLDDEGAGDGAEE